MVPYADHAGDHDMRIRVESYINLNECVLWRVVTEVLQVDNVNFDTIFCLQKVLHFNR